MSDKTLSKIIVVLGLTLCWLLVLWGNDETSLKEKNLKIQLLSRQVDSLISIKDSLYDENFVNLTTISRYELTLEYLEDVNPKAAKQFEDFLEHDTE